MSDSMSGPMGYNATKNRAICTGRSTCPRWHPNNLDLLMSTCKLLWCRLNALSVCVSRATVQGENKIDSVL